jgi:DNA mismatch endonuclease (patch repair protein)
VLSGTPDLVFIGSRTAVFLDGCFWHGCAQCARTPAARFWTAKIAKNRARDAAVTETLGKSGWRVLRIPEHDVRTKARLAVTIDEVVALMAEAPR